MSYIMTLCKLQAYRDLITPQCSLIGGRKKKTKLW